MADKKKKQQEAVETANGTFGELKAMVTDYAKQQTVDPLKNLGKWAGLGLAGAILMIIGAFLLSLGALRLFQAWDWTQYQGEGESDGWKTAVPYLFTFVLLITAAVTCFVAMGKTPDWMDDDA